MESCAGHRMVTGKRGGSVVPGLILGAGDWQKLGGRTVAHSTRCLAFYSSSLGHSEELLSPLPCSMG